VRRALCVRESRGELAEQTSSEAPNSSLARNWNHAVSQELTLLLCIDNVHHMPRVEETEFSAERFSNFAWIGCDVWCLWRYGNKHLHEEVARRNIRRIERSDKANLVFWVCSVKAELFMKFTDRCLLRGFAPLELATRKGDLPAVTAALCPLDQQHLAVERMRVNALAAARWAAAPQSHRWHQEGGHHCNARIAARRWIEVDRLKAWKS